MTTTKAFVALALLLLVTMVCAAAPQGNRWTAEQIAELSSLSLRELGAVPADPTNRVADDPQAAELGKRLFFDTRLSANGRVSYGTCHDPEREFQDGTPLAKGVGQPAAARCRLRQRPTARSSSGTAARTASGRRRWGRWKVRSSMAAHARRLRTSSPSTTALITNGSSVRFPTWLAFPQSQGRLMILRRGRRGRA
jgi:cytochrome c peroxidase